MPIHKQRCLTLPVGSGNVAAPADGSTMYFGGQISNEVMTIWAGHRRLYVPQKCRIRAIHFYFYALTVGTNETIHADLRVNGTTDYSIADVSSTDAFRIFSNDALDIPMKLGDYFEIKMTFPTWATNPENVYELGFVLADIGF